MTRRQEAAAAGRGGAAPARTPLSKSDPGLCPTSGSFCPCGFQPAELQVTSLHLPGHRFLGPQCDPSPRGFPGRGCASNDWTSRPPGPSPSAGLGRHTPSRPGTRASPLHSIFKATTLVTGASEQVFPASQGRCRWSPGCRAGQALRWRAWAAGSGVRECACPGHPRSDGRSGRGVSARGAGASPSLSKSGPTKPNPGGSPSNRTRRTSRWGCRGQRPHASQSPPSERGHREQQLRTGRLDPRSEDSEENTGRETPGSDARRGTGCDVKNSRQGQAGAPEGGTSGPRLPSRVQEGGAEGRPGLRFLCVQAPSPDGTEGTQRGHLPGAHRDALTPEERTREGDPRRPSARPAEPAPC